MEFAHLLVLMFLVAIGLVGYEMDAALRAPVCAECPHCRAGVEAAERQARADATQPVDRPGPRQDPTEPRRRD